MSEITPYINQHQNWGKDLLNRLNNLGDENGGFNVWEELPTEGPDGLPLGHAHKGLSGFLLAEQPAIQRWSGSTWEELLRVPVGFQGVPIKTVSLSAQGGVVTILDPGYQVDYFFILFNNNDGFLNLSRYEKTTGNLTWTATRALDPGYFFCSMRAVKSAQSWDIFGDRVYLGVSSYVSREDLTSNLSAVYCFSSLTGSFQWHTSLGLVTGSNSLGASLTATSLGVYYQIRDGSSYYLNSSSGVVINSNVSAPLHPSSSASSTFATSSNEIIAIGNLVGTGPLLRKVSSDISTIVFSENLSGGIFGSISQWEQDPSNKNIIYLYDNISPRKIWQYNASNNSFTLLSTFAEGTSLVGSIFAIKSNGTQEVTFVCSNGASVVEYVANKENQTISLYKASVPGGEGSVIPARSPGISQDVYRFLKTKTTARGFGGDSNVLLNVFISDSSRQFVFLNDAAFSSSGKLEDLSATSNFDDLQASAITSQRIITGRLALFDSSGAGNGSTPIGSYSNPDNGGLTIGTFGSLFSLFNWSGGLSQETIGYSSGSVPGGGVFGIGFNARPVAGRLVKMMATNATFSAVELFDTNLGRLMWEVKNTGATANTLISDFPGTQPTMTLRARMLGICNFSPTYALDVTGTMRATEVRNSGGVITSDPRMKLNMTSLSGEDSWEIINRINAISFLYKPDFTVTITEVSQDEEGNKTTSSNVQQWPLPQGIQIGYNADLVAETLPELVDIEPQSGIKYLNSGAIAPIVHQGTVWKINQLQQIIQQQQTLINQLTARVEALENAA
jgi:hypothetical protein